MVTFSPIEAEMKNLMQTLTKIENATTKPASAIIMQTSVFAIQSATKATEPGKSSTVKGLANKYKFRPLEKMVRIDGYWYSRPANGARVLFKTKTKINVRKKSNKHLKAVTRGIKYLNKKQSRYTHMPWEGKRDLSNKKFKIPHAGAAKAGWIGNLRNLGKTAESFDSRRPVSNTIKKLNGNDPFIIMENLVEYITQQSPLSAKRGLKAAEQRMLKTYKRVLEKAVTK